MWHWQQWYFAFTFSLSFILYVISFIGFLLLDNSSKALQILISLIAISISWYALYSYGFWN